MSDQVRNLVFHTLSDEWATLKRVTFDYRRHDGTWETQVRQTYDRGDGAVILPYDPDRGTVLLTRQFRIPAYVTGHIEPLIEAAAGLLDAERKFLKNHPGQPARWQKLMADYGLIPLHHGHLC